MDQSDASKKVLTCYGVAMEMMTQANSDQSLRTENVDVLIAKNLFHLVQARSTPFPVGDVALSRSICRTVNGLLSTCSAYHCQLLVGVQIILSSTV